MKQRELRRHQGGFTLIEIMVVIVILGILATFVAPKIMDSPDRARVVKAKNDIQTIKGQLDMYKLHNFHYPSTDQGLQALVQQPTGSPEARNWQKGGYIDRLPKDPWGNDYQYLNPGVNAEVDVFSYGADGRPGGDEYAADIGNWQD